MKKVKQYFVVYIHPDQYQEYLEWTRKISKGVDVDQIETLKYDEEGNYYLRIAPSHDPYYFIKLKQSRDVPFGYTRSIEPGKPGFKEQFFDGK